MKTPVILCILLLVLGMSVGALASGVDTYQFQHPERQSRAQDLARALRCPQCQNQNLVESNSPIAYSHAWRSLNNIHADHSITSMPITQ